MGLSDFFIPPVEKQSAESLRKARLIVSFGLLGSLFGALYASFYLIIGHRWGAGIIILCSLGFLLTPWILRRWQAAVAANFLSFILIVGFAALCGIEGGLRGHAIAWLVSIPLCALLLAGQRTGLVWCFLCLIAASIFIGLELSGRPMPILYDKRWETLVSGAGYLGLIIFMFILGLTFERGRDRANRAMHAALAELADANAHLRLLNQEKNEFLGIAAHDLKNPLSAVAGYAELIQMGMATSPEDIADCSSHILRATHQMIELITNILDVNAIEEGKLRLEPQRCDLVEILAHVVDTYRPPAKKKRLPIDWLPPAKAPLAKVDPRATHQIFDNLISNAVKYSFVGGQPIVIGLVEQPAHWLIEVRDAGPGLSEEDQGKLFGKFVRLTARPTGGESSNGLGLSIVRRMVTEMEGSIACRSKLGEGSVFAVSLPKWDGD